MYFGVINNYYSMKFWRHSLIATISFLAVSFSVVYTSCSDDACLKLKCRNGGTCADGICKCPTGYEGGQCERKASDRYLGYYDGTTIIDNKPPTIDSAYIAYTATDYGSATKLQFTLYSRPTDVIICSIGSDGKVSYTDDKFGGRVITILEENDQLNFTSIEHPNGKEQTIKFVGTIRK